MKIEVYSPTIRRKEMDAVLTAMVEEKIGPGERNRLLIQTAKEQIRFDYALALRSPAVALYLALKALNVKAGQAALLSALSPRYYLQVLEDLQLTPLYCDVSYDLPCMSREIIENTIAKKPDGLEICAVVLHHTLGYVPDTAAITQLGIPVIEDISQSYGSWMREEAHAKIDGVFCILGLEEKDMLTSGGGALLFAMNRKDGALLRNFTGIADEYCLPDINCALAVVQFREAQRNIDRRRDIGEVYIHASLSTRHKRFVPINKNDYCNYSFSLVLETGLKDVIAYAKKKEILLENAFEKTIAGSSTLEGCPVSNSLTLRTVLFPMYPRLRSSEVERVSRLIMTLP
jgi:dTDP-4-amino-4,6-dideoxygalactose transaminase